MNKIYYILLFITTFVKGQTIQKHSGSGDNIGRDKNIIYQKNIRIYKTTVEYNTEKRTDLKSLFEYLKTIPNIKKQLDSVFHFTKNSWDNSKELEPLFVDLINKASFAGILYVDSLKSQIESYKSQLLASKVDNEKLIANTTNSDYVKTLELANKKLEYLDNNGYQDILENFKIESESKIKQINKDKASASFLQAKNSYITIRFEKALEQINFAILNDENNAKYISLKSQIFYSLYNPDSTLYYSKLVLKILSASNEDSYILLARANDYIGLTLLDDFAYDSALIYFKKSLSLIAQKNNPYLSILYNNIGSCYKKKQIYDSALNYFKKSYYILNLYYNESYPELISNFNKVGSVYHDIFKISRKSNHWDSAFFYYQKTIYLCKKYYEERNPELAQSYSDIGVLYYNVRNYNEAIKYGLMSVRVFEKTLGEKHREASDSYGNLGQSYLGLLNYIESIKYFSFQYDTQIKTYGKTNYQTKNTASLLYITYLLNGENNKAYNILKEYKFSNLTKFNIIATSEFLFENEGNFILAEKLIEIAVEFAKINNIVLPIDKTIYLKENLALAYCKTGRKEESCSLFKTSINLAIKNKFHQNIIKAIQKSMIDCGCR